MVNLLHLRPCTGLQRLAQSTLLTALALGFWIGVTGCQTPSFSGLASKDGSASADSALVLHEGDTVQITFAGAPGFNTTQQIRRDGRITLTQVGEFKAADLTPEQLQKELLRLYDAQLQTKECTVTVQSAAFPVYVMGAVQKPGKFMFDRPTTALEAIMEAGGFDSARADSKAVVVIRKENGHSQNFKLNLKRALKQGDAEPFGLKPTDIVYVPERFVWF